MTRKTVLAVASLLCLDVGWLAGCYGAARGGEDQAAQAATAVPAPRGKLQGEPTISKINGGYEIAFALTLPNDITVRIVDAKGQIVRHLAAGMVGVRKAARPIADQSLSQKLAWDGKDDAGKEVAAAGHRALIGVGAAAKFEKFILYNPDGFGNIGTPNWSGLGCIAVGPKGDLYVVEQYGVHYSTMRVFNRQGHFLRCVWPLSMDKSRETLEPFLASTMTIWPGNVAAWAATDYQGRVVPRSVRHSAFYWFGVRNVAMAVGPEGDVFLVDAFPNFAQMLRIGGDGLPKPMKTVTPWIDKGSYLRRWNLAIGPEGDVYVSDKSSGIVAHLDQTASKTVESYLYRDTEELDQPTYLLGRPDAGTAGQYDPLLGLAVDKQQRVWVAKPKEKCIKVYEKDGRLRATINSITTKQGSAAITGEGIALAANHSSGAIYVNCQGVAKGSRKLVKLTAPDTPKAQAEIDLPGNARNIAADGEGNIVWVAVGSDKLLRAVDAGEKFEVTTLDGQAGNTVTFPRLLHLDRQGRLYVADSSSNYVQSDVDGNNVKRFSWNGVGGHGYCATDTQGNWYVPILLGTRFAHFSAPHARGIALLS
jgi:hypothetical protein